MRRGARHAAAATARPALAPPLPLGVSKRRKEGDDALTSSRVRLTRGAGPAGQRHGGGARLVELRRAAGWAAVGSKRRWADWVAGGPVSIVTFPIFPLGFINVFEFEFQLQI
jgi:hypothetical protein